MSALKWSKNVTEYGGVKDVEWIASADDKEVARAYKGGISSYPWSGTMPGHKVHATSTLGAMKAQIQREYDKESER